MRTFQSEARRLIWEHAPGEPVPDGLGDSWLWVLFMMPKRRWEGQTI